jgi:hypothetical protein
MKTWKKIQASTNRNPQMFFMTINGTKYSVNIVDGQKVYFPPLPESLAKKFMSKCQDMLESRKPPGHRSDTQFHAGRGTLLDQLEGDVNWTNHIASQARKRGYTVGANDVYIGQLDDDKGGNPDAFFKPGEGLSEMKRRLQKSGKGCDMPGLYVAPDPNKIPKQKALNPKVTKRMMDHYTKTGEAGSMTKQELKSYVEKKHGRPVKQ